MKYPIRIMVIVLSVSALFSGCGKPSLNGEYFFQDAPERSWTFMANGSWTNTYGEAGTYSVEGGNLVIGGPFGISMPGRIEGDQVTIQVPHLNERLKVVSKDRILIKKDSKTGKVHRLTAEASECWDREDFSGATQRLQEAADLGDANAQQWLGLAYALGRGVSQDQAKAVACWQKALAQGDVKAGYWLAAHYWEGDLVPQDRAKALDLCQRAADQGFARAQDALAWFHAVSTDPRYQDGEKALAYALKVTSEEPKNWRYLDTLAAAYARNGRFDEAVRQQEQALNWLRLATGFASYGAKQDVILNATARLELFRRQQAYSEDTAPGVRFGNHKAK